MRQADERKDEILKMLDLENKVYVTELSQKFSVSEVTIRKDLKELEDAGSLHRVHGGAERVRHSRVAVESTLGELIVTHMDEKRAIAQCALEYVENGDALLLDASTTTLQMARLLAESNLTDLTVITPSLEIAMALGRHEGSQVIMIGGIVRPSLATCMGPITTETLKGLHADKAFIGLNGIDVTVGLTTQNLLECEVKRAILNSSTRSFALADASKFNTVALGVIGPVQAVDYIISDARISAGTRARIEDLGIEVIVAS